MSDDWVKPRDRRFDSFEQCAPVVRDLEMRIKRLEERVSFLGKILSTHGTPWWKRIIFWIDGWGPWWTIQERPKWRPWRRWYRS